MEQPETSHLVAQFVVPRIAADAVDVPTLAREAAAAGVEWTRIEMNTRGAGAGKIRLTCNVAMAERLIATWSRLAEEVPANEYGIKLRAGLGLAVAAGTAACDDARNPRRPSLGESGYIERRLR